MYEMLQKASILWITDTWLITIIINWSSKEESGESE